MVVRNSYIKIIFAHTTNGRRSRIYQGIKLLPKNANGNYLKILINFRKIQAKEYYN